MLADEGCGLGGVFSIRFSVSLNFFSSSAFAVSDMAKSVLEEAANELFLALGRAITAWNGAEVAMLRCFKELLQSDDVAAYAVWQSFQSLSPRLDLIDQLAAKRRTEAEASRLAELTRYSKVLAGERNFIAHNGVRPAWPTKHTGGQFVLAGDPLVRAAKMLKKDYSVNASELDELSADFKHLHRLWRTTLEGLETASLDKYLAPIVHRRPLRASRPQAETPLIF